MGWCCAQPRRGSLAQATSGWPPAYSRRLSTRSFQHRGGPRFRRHLRRPTPFSAFPNGCLIRSAPPARWDNHVAAELTRFDSTHWIRDIDVPTSVLITLRDRIFSARRQRWLASQIPEAHTVTVDAGHAGCTLQSDKFVPGLGEAISLVHRRVQVGAFSSSATQGNQTSRDRN